MELEITKMQLSDLEQIKEKLLEDFDDFWTVNILKEEIQSEKSQYIVAKQNQGIVGFAGIRIIIDEVEIMNIVVRKDKRQEGIGSRLLQEILKTAKEQNAQVVILEVNEKNQPAIKLYQKFGFEQIGLRKNTIIIQTMLLLCHVRLGTFLFLTKLSGWGHTLNKDYNFTLQNCISYPYVTSFLRLT